MLVSYRQFARECIEFESHVETEEAGHIYGHKEFIEHTLKFLMYPSSGEIFACHVTLRRT